MFFSLIAAGPVFIWLYLATARAGYWRMSKYSLPAKADRKIPQRKIVAIIPARNEADVVGECLRSLLTQELPEPLRIVLVDDGSNDGTSDVAREVARRIDRQDHLTVIRGEPLPSGWTGKLWAMSQGIRRGEEFEPDYLLLTDADISHGPDTIARLLLTAESRGADLSSIMVRLATKTVAEKLLIPAFVYFFFQLYPPDWTADPGANTAGAAGGCILIRAETLRSIGGVRAIAGEMIDDCALAALVKKSGGSVWMGQSDGTFSLRSYGGFAAVGKMISRSAFNQLRHSSALLVLTLAGLFVTYVLPPVLVFDRRKPKRLYGISACLLMFMTYAPTVTLYRQRVLSTVCLPLVALFYAGATIHSAVRYWTGAGGEWKGRIQDHRGAIYQRFLLPPKSR